MTDLELLVAKDAIREAMAKYCHALDAYDFAGVAALFAADGVWATDYGGAKGPAEIEAFLRDVVPAKEVGPARKHYVCNTVINVTGETASAASDYLVVRQAENEILPVVGGTYEDGFRKVDGSWLFTRKSPRRLIAGDMKPLVKAV